MEIEFHLLYRSLMIHHLERTEIEYELKIRGIHYDEKESRADLRRRWNEHRKIKKGQYSDVYLNRLETMVDEEIKLIDESVREINDSLKNRDRREMSNEKFKTRLVHYFKRLRRLTESTEDEEDLADIDLLVECIRETFNRHFSDFFHLCPMQPWMFAYPQMQMWDPLGAMPGILDNKPSFSNFANLVDTPNPFRPEPKRLGNDSREPKSGGRKSRPVSKLSSSPESGWSSEIYRKPSTFDRDCGSASSSESGWSSGESRKSSNVKPVARSSKPRPITDWWSRYDGTNCTKIQLLRSIIHPLTEYAIPWSKTSGEEVGHLARKTKSN